MAPTSPDYEYIPLVAVGVGPSTLQLPIPLSRAWPLPHKNRPMARVAWYPLSLLVLYLILSFWPKHLIHLEPPTYLSYAGKSSLATTITLPKLQYKFPKNQS